MAYYLETIETGKVREIIKWRKAPKTPRAEARAARKNSTCEAVAEINAKNAERRLRWNINSTARAGDYWITLTYSKELRPTHEQSQADYERFMRRLRALYKKLGVKLYYFAAVEMRHSHKPHVHILLPQGVALSEIQALWSFGHINVRPLDSSGNYAALARYIIEHTNCPERGNRKRWNQGGAVVIVHPTIKEIAAKKWREDIKPPKGWEIDKSVPAERGYNPFSGAEYFKYTLIKQPDVGRCRQKGARVGGRESYMRERGNVL